MSNSKKTVYIDGTWASNNCFNPDGDIPFNESSAYLVHNLDEQDTRTPVEEYWK